MINFCEECNKIVPETEIKCNDLFGKDKLFHVYTKMKNLYNNAGTNRIGCCLVKETVLCGRIREPSDMEYFIHHTLGISGK